MSVAKPKFNVTVQLTGRSGNAFVVLDTVKKALREAGVGKPDIDAYMAAAMAGDYNHLLRVTMETVHVE